MNEDIPKLKVGDKIQVFGNVMMEGLYEGIYTVKDVYRSKYLSGDNWAYYLVRKRCRNGIRHKASRIDYMISPQGIADLNRIEILDWELK